MTQKLTNSKWRATQASRTYLHISTHQATDELQHGCLGMSNQGSIICEKDDSDEDYPSLPLFSESCKVEQLPIASHLKEYAILKGAADIWQ